VDAGIVVDDQNAAIFLCGNEALQEAATTSYSLRTAAIRDRSNVRCSSLSDPGSHVLRWKRFPFLRPSAAIARSEDELSARRSIVRQLAVR
jgi:hypothetical protein